MKFMQSMINIETTIASPRTWLGYQRMMDAISKGENLSNVLFDLAKHYKTSETINFDLFNGGLMCLLDSWSSLVTYGVISTVNDKRVEGFLNGSRARMLCDLVRAESSDSKLFSALIYGICYSVNNMRQYIRFTVTKPAPVAEKALAVRIVSEPDRITTQTVQRDENLEIVSTTTRTVNA